MGQRPQRSEKTEIIYLFWLFHSSEIHVFFSKSVATVNVQADTDLPQERREGEHSEGCQVISWHGQWLDQKPEFCTCKTNSNKFYTSDFDNVWSILNFQKSQGCQKGFSLGLIPSSHFPTAQCLAFSISHPLRWHSQWLLCLLMSGSPMHCVIHEDPSSKTPSSHRCSASASAWHYPKIILKEHANILLGIALN